MHKIVYEKTFQGNSVELVDPTDFIDNDDVVTDIFGDAHGTFTVTVTYTPPDYDPDEE